MIHFAVIASVPERFDLVQDAVESLIPQASVEVFRNEAWGASPGDYGKFHWLGKVDCDYYFTCDDDLIYPPDYCSVMAHYAETLQTVVTLHGREFAGHDQPSYYEGEFVYYRCLETVADIHPVDVPGSGVSCIPRVVQKRIAEHMPACRSPQAADLHLAIACKRAGVVPLVVPHERGWLTNNGPEDGRTIYREQSPRKTGLPDTVQTEMLREVLASRPKWPEELTDVRSEVPRSAKPGDSRSGSLLANIYDRVRYALRRP